MVSIIRKPPGQMTPPAGRRPNPFTVDARPTSGGINPMPRPVMPDGAPTGTGGQGRPVMPPGPVRTPNPFTVDAIPKPPSVGTATGARPNVGGMPGAIMKKGGKVTAKAPVKKAAGGKVAAKPVAKKAGGKVAAKPMAKGRKR
jgi:hypothetical protein